MARANQSPRLQTLRGQPTAASVPDQLVLRGGVAEQLSPNHDRTVRREHRAGALVTAHDQLGGTNEFAWGHTSLTSLSDPAGATRKSGRAENGSVYKRVVFQAMLEEIESPCADFVTLVIWFSSPPREDHYA